MRTRDEITRLASDAGAAPGSPAADMITETARRLITTEGQIAGQARHVRDALDGIAGQLTQAEPGLGREPGRPAPRARRPDAPSRAARPAGRAARHGSSPPPAAPAPAAS